MAHLLVVSKCDECVHMHGSSMPGFNGSYSKKKDEEQNGEVCLLGLNIPTKAAPVSEIFIQILSVSNL
jgi:hypothetical protein